MSTTTQALQGEVVAAMFEDRGAAEAARSELEAVGIAPTAIDIIDQPLTAMPQSGLAHPHADGHRRSIWERIAALFGAYPQAHGYAEGVARGHAMVFVRAAQDHQAAVMDILARRQPIDLMLREQEWEASGWTGTYQLPPVVGAPVVPPVLFSDSP